MAFSLFSTSQPQQSQQLFQSQPQSQPQLFQQSSALFSQQPQQFQLQQQQLMQQQQQLMQQQQQLFIFTNDKAPASYGTKWADLHPDSQKILIQIEERILEYRDESQRLDQCSRLYDSSVSNDGFELDASRIVQELGGISTSTEHQKVLLQELMTTAKGMLWNTEVAIRSFMKIRPRFLNQSEGGASNSTAPPQVSGATSPIGSSGQPTSTSIAPVFDFYSGLPSKPSPFLQQTVSRFEKYLGECRQWIEELEQFLALDSNRSASNSSTSLFHSLPKIMSNVHEFFVHVAAKVESIHQYIDSMKAAYLADQRCRGDGNNPFLEADRRETARQEAAAKRVHPTLHLTANTQPSTQAAGLLASSGSHGASTVQQLSTVATPASSGGGLSLFSTPSAPSTTSSSLFMTPTASVQTSSLFSSSGATGPTTLFGSSSAPLFNSAITPFGSTAQSFGQSASAGSSLFSTPFASEIIEAKVPNGTTLLVINDHG
ncbi:Nuclear pore complex protein NUP58, partial [Cucurbita argyrosperma subsp. argyrosperma]